MAGGVKCEVKVKSWLKRCGLREIIIREMPFVLGIERERER
jgi:hypothetical protein